MKEYSCDRIEAVLPGYYPLTLAATSIRLHEWVDEIRWKRGTNLSCRPEFENLVAGGVFSCDALVDFFPIVLVVDVVPCFL